MVVEDSEGTEMQREWKGRIAGIVCICLATFAMAGCHSAQQVAIQPGASKPAPSIGSAQATGPAAHGTAAKDAAKVDGKSAAAKPANDQQQLKTEAKQAESDTAQAAGDLLTGLKNEFDADPYPPSGEMVNINYSSEAKILTLPGINHELAMKMIRSRPYATPTDLIAKHVLTQDEYNRIKTRLTAWDNLWTQEN